jgi:hypothetical protein
MSHRGGQCSVSDRPCEIYSEKVAVDEVFLRVFRFPFISIIPSMLHVALTRRKNGRSLGIFQKQCSVGNRVTLNRKVLFMFNIINICRSSCTVSYLRTILTKIGMCQQIVVKIPNTKFHKNPYGGSGSHTCGLTCRNDEVISQLHDPGKGGSGFRWIADWLGPEPVWTQSQSGRFEGEKNALRIPQSCSPYPSHC